MKKEFTYSRAGEGDIERDNEQWAKAKGWLKIWKKLKREVNDRKKKKQTDN